LDGQHARCDEPQTATSITGCSFSTAFFACIQWTWWPGRYDLQDRSIARISPMAIALLLNAEPPLAEIPKDAEHASQGFERLACGLFMTHQITEGSTLG
jgi:hypothetical protein